MRRAATKEPTLMYRLISVCCLVLIGLTDSVVAGDPQTVLFLSDEAPVFLRLNIELNGGDYEAPWHQYIDELFSDLDDDRDGILRGGETVRIPRAQQLGQLGFRSLRDQELPEGDVTREQLDAYLRLVVGPVFEVLEEAGQSVGAPDPFQPMRRYRSDENLFKGLDANQDGAVSADEFAITAALRKMDLDDDEAIGRAELEPTAISFFMSAPQSRPLAGTGPFFHITPQQSSFEIARKILDRYDRDQSAAKDRQLDASEIRIPVATFSVLDADGNGSLDFDEVVAMVRRQTTHLEITVRTGTRHGVEIKEPESGLPFHGFLRKEKNPHIDLVIGKTEIEIGPDGVGAQTSTSGELMYRQYLSRYDGDKNGYLDEAESQRTPFRNAFKLIDRDGNGMLVEQELVAYGKQIATATRSQSSLHIADRGNGLFGILDADNDQRLTARELVAARKWIAEWDADDDQRVGVTEFPRHWQLTVSHGNRNSQSTALRIAASRSSRVSGSSRGPVWFQKMDRNRDGDVSEREFLGPSNDFQRIDLDGDGLLSPTEAIELTRSK